MNGGTASTGRTARRRARAHATALLACLAALGLLAAGAHAATVTLKCAGKGARNKDSAGTVLCAASPSKGRTLAGVVRDDAGKPVAATLTVTYSSWTPVKTGGYVVRPRATRRIRAKANGAFSIKSKTATKESIRVETAGDADLGVSPGAFAQAEVSRQLVVKLRKLGGTSVRFTVKGTKHRPIKVWVLSETGYQLPGIKPRKIDRKGQATFHLPSSYRGMKLAYFVDAGVWGDLFWYVGRPTFKL